MAEKITPPFEEYCSICDDTVQMSIAYGVKNLHKDEGEIITVGFLCEHKRKWITPQEKAVLRNKIL